MRIGGSDEDLNDSPESPLLLDPRPLGPGVGSSSLRFPSAGVGSSAAGC